MFYDLKLLTFVAKGLLHISNRDRYFKQRLSAGFLDSKQFQQRLQQICYLTLQNRKLDILDFRWLYIVNYEHWLFNFVK